jgi:hypothetical protein
MGSEKRPSPSCPHLAAVRGKQTQLHRSLLLHFQARKVGSGAVRPGCGVGRWGSHPCRVHPAAPASPMPRHPPPPAAGRRRAAAAAGRGAAVPGLRRRLRHPGAAPTDDLWRRQEAAVLRCDDGLCRRTGHPISLLLLLFCRLPPAACWRTLQRRCLGSLPTPHPMPACLRPPGPTRRPGCDA